MCELNEELNQVAFHHVETTRLLFVLTLPKVFTGIQSFNVERKKKTELLKALPFLRK